MDIPPEVVLNPEFIEQDGTDNRAFLAFAYTFAIAFCFMMIGWVIWVFMRYPFLLIPAIWFGFTYLVIYFILGKKHKRASDKMERLEALIERSTDASPDGGGG